MVTLWKLKNQLFELPETLYFKRTDIYYSSMEWVERWYKVKQVLLEKNYVEIWKLTKNSTVYVLFIAKFEKKVVAWSLYIFSQIYNQWRSAGCIRQGCTCATLKVT